MSHLTLISLNFFLFWKDFLYPHLHYWHTNPKPNTFTCAHSFINNILPPNWSNIVGGRCLAESCGTVIGLAGPGTTHTQSWHWWQHFGVLKPCQRLSDAPLWPHHVGLQPEREQEVEEEEEREMVYTKSQTLTETKGWGRRKERSWYCFPLCPTGPLTNQHNSLLTVSHRLPKRHTQSHAFAQSHCIHLSLHTQLSRALHALLRRTHTNRLPAVISMTTVPSSRDLWVKLIAVVCLSRSFSLLSFSAAVCLLFWQRRLISAVACDRRQLQNSYVHSKTFTFTLPAVCKFPCIKMHI